MSLSSRGATASKKSLPLLDIQLYYKDPNLFVEQLRSACHSVGFFLLQHDIPHEVVQQQLDETRKFFQRPIHDKLSISYKNSPSFRGYMRIGVENTAGAVDLREQIEYAAIYNTANATNNNTKDDNNKPWPPYERLKTDSNPWPHTFQPSLQAATEDYVPHVNRIADCIRQALCQALNVSKNVLDPLFGTLPTLNQNTHQQPHWVLKLISYPVIKADKSKQDTDEAATSFGVGGHTDSNFLTMVLQDDVGGLQVYSEGDWINVPSNLGPGVLVCNLGEQAEIMSRGYFLATPHRVLANVNGCRDRISVPLFYNPMLSATIHPIVPEKLEGLNWERGGHEHWRRKSNAMLATVGDNTFKSLARSHPIVFEKHHSDLNLLSDGSVVRKEEIAKP